MILATEGNADSIRHVVGSILEIPMEQFAELRVRMVPGGITNKLYHVSGIRPVVVVDDQDETNPSGSKNHNNNIPSEVLVRIFGAQGMIDRDVETSTYAALAKQGLALPYYGRFGNGRLEGWWPNSQHLEVRELSQSQLSRGIAQSLGQLHARFVVPPELQEYHNPKAPPTLWTQLESWLEQAKQATFSPGLDAQRAAKLPLSQLQEELNWLQQDVCNRDARVGFCHNDLLAANILRKLDQGNLIQIIDFEYGGMNYLAYDIANHFNEFAGGTNENENATPDYALFPWPEWQKTFVRTYLSASGSNDDDDDDEAVQTILWEIKGFVLANHLVWGLWAVNQAASEGCQKFDYLQYASCRIQRYFLEKKQWQSNAQH